MKHFSSLWAAPSPLYQHGCMAACADLHFAVQHQPVQPTVFASARSAALEEALQAMSRDERYQHVLQPPAHASLCMLQLA
jgi:hypothetical protein